VQGAFIQAMFLERIQSIQPSLMARLHDEPGYRPFTLSPLGVYGEKGHFQGFWLPRDHLIAQGSTCYLRMTLLDDGLFPIVSQGFQQNTTSTFSLGDTHFTVTDLLTTGHAWSDSRSYPELIDRALHYQHRRKLRFKFLSPTSFRQGKLDLPLPLPRLVFQSYKKRFETFYHVAFLPDFEQQIEQQVGIATMRHVNTAVIHTKHVRSLGFTGNVVFIIHPKAPPELVFQVNLLTEFATFCGTGKKTALGMGQTLISSPTH